MIDSLLFRDVLRSEWTKLRSVRSTYWTVLTSVVLAIGIGAAISAGNAHAYSDMSLSDKLLFDPTSDSTAGLFFAQLALGVLAIMAITSEYSTGTIRTTISAVPQRGYVLAAKSLLVGLVCVGLGLAMAFGAFFLGQLIFEKLAPSASITDPGVARAVIGAGLYIGVLALFALGLGAIIRHTAGAITALVAIVFIIPIVSNLLPDTWQRDFSSYLPANAGGAITLVVHQPNTLHPWVGFAVFAAWAVAAIGVGWLMLRRRDV